MTISLNGTPREVDEPSPTVLRLLELLDLGGRPVLVELNGTAIFVRDFKSQRVEDGDVVEIVRMVAGG